MPRDIKEIKKEADKLFTCVRPMHTLWQDIALNFYPERADFTVNFTEGYDLGGHLITGSPVQARQDLSNIFQMQRPADKMWARMMPKYETDMSRIDQAGLEFFDFVNNRMFRAMYDKDSGFTRATKEGDDSFAAFGQTVISVEFSMKNRNLLIRNHHLRDTVWNTNENGRVKSVFNKRKLSIRQQKNLFKNISPNLLNEKDLDKTWPIYHMVVPADEYYTEKDERNKLPFVSIYYDCINDFVLEVSPSRTRKYIIPRWVTVSGSQYAYSPCTIVAMSDAKMLQKMTYTILNAGELAVNPAMLGVEEAIKSDLELFPGGFTTIDAEYDERLGEVLRPLIQDKSGLPFGIELQREVELKIKKAFFLDKIGLPPLNKEMTAFEVSQRVSEYVREAIPLFQPYETEYNGELLDMIFETLMGVGAFGSDRDIPESIQGLDTTFVFESALQGAREQQKSQKFLETKAIIAEGAGLDPNVAGMMNVEEAMRDVFSGIGTPQKWLVGREEFQEKKQQEAQMAAQQQMLAGLQQGGMAAEQLGKGAIALQESNLGI